nr:reverse transcriptase domain-containing protein [Tanacetum cinerariifolium]
VEAEALPTNDAQVLVKFLRKLFSRFRVPNALIIDRETHLCSTLLEKTLRKYGVMHRLATPYHPQTSGQTKNTNRAIKRVLKRTMNGNRKQWADKLDDALWAFRTGYKTQIVSTLFRIVHGKACHLPIEMEHKAYRALKNVNLDLDTAGKHRYLQLNKLAKLRNEAYEHSRAYKERTKRWNDVKIIDKEFNEKDKVLLFNSMLKLFPGKLISRWYGPYTISKVFPYETVVCGKNGVYFKVNGHRLKTLRGRYKHHAKNSLLCKDGYKHHAKNSLLCKDVVRLECNLKTRINVSKPKDEVPPKSKNDMPLRDNLLKYSESNTEYGVKLDDPNSTMEEHIRLKEEKSCRRGMMYNWETATYGKIWDNEDVLDLLKLNSQL